MAAQERVTQIVVETVVEDLANCQYAAGSDTQNIALGETSSLYINAGPEILSTLAQSLLTVAMDDTVDTVTIFNGKLFPKYPTFRIRIGNEVMRVIGVTGLNFKVARGQEGTAATSHIVGSVVRSCLTVESLTVFTAQHGSRAISGPLSSQPLKSVDNTLYMPTDQQTVGVYDEMSQIWQQYGPMRAVNPPSINQFTWANRGGATAYFDGGCLTLQSSYQNVSNAQVLWKPIDNPARPWSVTIGVLTSVGVSNYQRCGLFIGSSTYAGHISWFNSLGNSLLVTRYNGSFVGVTDLSQWVYMNGGSRLLWLKYSEDASNRYFWSSIDNIYWSLNYQEANNTTFMADRIGLGMDYQFDSTVAQFLTCYHWQESNP